MKPGSRRPALLAVAVLLAAGPAWAAVPLKEVTQEKIRDWAAASVKASRDDPKQAEFWKELDPLLAVDPQTIFYEHDKGVPVKLVWESKVKHDLNRMERLKATKDLRRLLNRAISSQLSEEDAKLLEAVARVQLVAELKARPLKELTEDQVRDWAAEAIRATRKDPAWTDTWKQLDRLVIVDPEEIIYEHDKGKPVKLVWEVAPRHRLTPEQRGKAQEDLKKLFSYVLFEHNNGLVPAGEMEVLKTLHQVEIKPNAIVRRPEKLPPTTPVKDLTEDTVRDWMVVSAEKSRQDPAFVEIWKELDDLVEIDPSEIIYEHDKGVPTRLHWEVTPKHNLTPAQRLKVKADVNKLLQAMLFEHDKGLVPAEEMEVVKDVAQVEIGPNPETEVATPDKPANPPTDIEKINKALDELKVEHDKLKKDYADAQTEIENIKKAHAEEVEKLKKQHDADMAEIEKLKKGLPPEPADIEKLKKAHAAEIDKLKTDHGVEIDNQKKQHDADAVVLEKLTKDQGVALAEIENLKKERAAILADIEKCKTEHAAALLALEKLRKQLDDNTSEFQKLKKDYDRSQFEIERLKKVTPGGSTDSGSPGGSTGSGSSGGSTGGYIMVVQPSSMIYYDCASHCWLPGPASVVYYPAGSTAPRRAELPRPPAFVAPLPRPASGLPPPEQPRQEISAPPPDQPPSQQKQESQSDEAVRAFWIGYRSYWQGDYDRALASFDSAVRVEDRDARFWYYKALAERALGEAEKAEASAKRGRELHAALKPKADLVGAALERVQGQERRFLNAPEAVISAAKDGQ